MVSETALKRTPAAFIKNCEAEEASESSTCWAVKLALVKEDRDSACADCKLAVEAESTLKLPLLCTFMLPLLSKDREEAADKVAEVDKLAVKTLPSKLMPLEVAVKLWEAEVSCKVAVAPDKRAKVEPDNRREPVVELTAALPADCRVRVELAETTDTLPLASADREPEADKVT